MKISKIASLCLASSITFMVGCGSSSDNNTNNTSSIVKGSVVDEKIANGIVKAYESSLNGKLLGETRTDENGSYVLDINYSGPVVISVSCDDNSSFIEDNGSKVTCNLSSPLLSVNIANNNSINENVTPISTELVYLATNGDLNNTITPENLQKAKKVIAYLYGIDPVIIDPLTNSNYKNLINALHKFALDNNINIMDLVEDFKNDMKDGVIGNNGYMRGLMNDLKGIIKSPLLDSDTTDLNISSVEESSIPYDGIIATKNVVQDLRDNLYSISNQDENGTLDKEVKDFNTAINRDVIKNTQTQLDVFGYVLNAAVDSEAPMSGSVDKNGNTYDYNVIANSDNTEFNYTITWNDKDYKGIIKTSQDYKNTNSPDDLNTDMFIDINGSLPSTDNKTIYAKATAHKNSDNTFTFYLNDAKIKGDKDYLEIQNIEIDGKYFTYQDSDGNESGDLNYIKFNNIELNSKINNQFEINGILSLNWIQNSYIKNKYPDGSYEELYWLESVVTCEDNNNNDKAPTGGYVLFKYNGKNYQLNSSWSNDDKMAFKNDFGDNPLIMAESEGDLEEYVENQNNYDLSNVQCPTGYSPKIKWIEKDMGENFANEGYVPNKITFKGSVKDITTNIELDGKIESTSNDIQSVDLTKDDVIPTIDTTLNVNLIRPNYPNTLLNAEYIYNTNKTSKLSLSYFYNNDLITIIGNWKADQSGDVTITDTNGVKIDIPVNTDGDIIFTSTSVTFNGEKVGSLEDRGEDLPVIHFTDGSVESIY